MSATKGFELIGGALCLDFVNTIHDYAAADPDEELLTFQDLLSFATQTGAINTTESRAFAKWALEHPDAAGKALSSARQSRSMLYRVFSAIAAGKRPSSSDMRQLNRMLAQTYGKLQLRWKEADLQWSWTEDDENPHRLLWPVVRSAVELLTSTSQIRLRECESATCTWMFLDHSKNGTRRWCEMKKCGNRAKWRRHYEKTKGKPQSHRGTESG